MGLIDQAWLDAHPPEPPAKKRNPMLRLHGPALDGLTCRTCVHLVAHHYQRTYYKCDLRKITGGPATDHRVGWPACGRYEAHETGREL